MTVEATAGLAAEAPDNGNLARTTMAGLALLDKDLMVQEVTAGLASRQALVVVVVVLEGRGNSRFPALVAPILPWMRVVLALVDLVWFQVFPGLQLHMQQVGWGNRVPPIPALLLLLLLILATVVMLLVAVVVVVWRDQAVPAS